MDYNEKLQQINNAKESGNVVELESIKQSIEQDRLQGENMGNAMVLMAAEQALEKLSSKENESLTIPQWREDQIVRTGGNDEELQKRTWEVNDRLHKAETMGRINILSTIPEAMRTPAQRAELIELHEKVKEIGVAATLDTSKLNAGAAIVNQVNSSMDVYADHMESQIASGASLWDMPSDDIDDEPVSFTDRIQPSAESVDTSHKEYLQNEIGAIGNAISAGFGNEQALQRGIDLETRLNEYNKPKFEINISTTEPVVSAEPVSVNMAQSNTVSEPVLQEPATVEAAPTQPVAVEAEPELTDFEKAPLVLEKIKNAKELHELEEALSMVRVLHVGNQTIDTYIPKYMIDKYFSGQIDASEITNIGGLRDKAVEIRMGIKAPAESFELPVSPEQAAGGLLGTESFELDSIGTLLADSGLDAEDMQHYRERVEKYGPVYNEIKNTREFKNVVANIRREYNNAKTHIGISSSQWGQSDKWIILDICKQKYLAEHPEESNENYLLIDPMGPQGPEIAVDIAHRHIGWEILNQVISGDKKIVNYLHKGMSSYQPIVDLLEEGVNNNRLPSYKLSLLGKMVKENFAGISSEPVTRNVNTLGTIEPITPTVQQAPEQVFAAPAPDPIEFSVPDAESILDQNRQSTAEGVSLKPVFNNSLKYPINKEITIKRSSGDPESGWKVGLSYRVVNGEKIFSVYKGNYPNQEGALHKEVTETELDQLNSEPVITPTIDNYEDVSHTEDSHDYEDKIETGNSIEVDENNPEFQLKFEERLLQRLKELTNGEFIKEFGEKATLSKDGYIISSDGVETNYLPSQLDYPGSLYQTQKISPGELREKVKNEVKMEIISPEKSLGLGDVYGQFRNLYINKPTIEPNQDQRVLMAKLATNMLQIDPAFKSFYENSHRVNKDDFYADADAIGSYGSQKGILTTNEWLN